MNPIDAHCMAEFPELLDRYSEKELREASEIGTYIFHEDYFSPFVAESRRNEMLLQRAANYIEMLASSDDEASRNLASIGILESLVNVGTVEIAKSLGPYSQALLKNAAHRTRFDPSIWLRVM